MENLEAYNMTKSLFTDLITLHNINALNSFVKKSELTEQIITFYEKYPSYNFSLTLSEINHLRDNGIINESNLLDPDKFPQDPLAKILAAVLWKNGDIKKIQHIIDGITGRTEDRTEYSLIFKQFGASLANDEEPIVDQHVLRAFELYSLEAYTEEAVAKIRKKELYKTKDKPLLEKYRIWFKQLLSKVPDAERAEFRDSIDKVIFIHGKAVKI